MEEGKTKKKRISKLSQCIRNASATVRLPRNAMPDSPHLNRQVLTKETSAKFTKLIENIKTLDEEDIRDHGKLFKHFIFTDLRESAYGAKAVASFLIEHGFDFRMALERKQIMRQGKLVSTKAGETQLVDKKAPNGFAILQSLPLWKNPISVKTKKDILRVFNSRPDNIQGEKLRIIVLDSKFKEGIDLFDVKYVHLLEPPISNSDLKQAVGRATRFCGQKGLTFIPNRGWPLEVFVYSIQLPNSGLFQHGEGDLIDAHDLLMLKSGLDLALLNLVKECTVLAIRGAVDYDLNYKINNFNVEAAVIAEVVLPSSQSGGNREKATLVQIHGVDDITPELLQKCFTRKSKLFPFSKARMNKEAQRLGIQIPKNAKRAWYCEQLTSNPIYLEKLLKPEEVDRDSIDALRNSEEKSAFSASDTILSEIPNDLISLKLSDSNENEKSVKESDKRSEEESKEESVKRSDKQSEESVKPSVKSSVKQSDKQSKESDKPSPLKPLSPRPNTATDEALLRVRMLFPSPNESRVAPIVKKSFDVREAVELLKSLKNKPFSEFQDGVAGIYSKFKWESPVIKNGCEQIAAGQPGKPVSFTKTQDFIRHYLMPDSPFKGILAWHSVGTGKTCMAVAAATTQFEQAGYKILWVTRNALMADVYKNIFGSVCSIPIMKALEDGKLIPADLTAQKRMLSKGWLPPISYRTFQNALQGKNEIGRLLAKNPNGDPLHKTFLIMDEIHKLQDGDLGANESADFHIIQKYIQDSYAKSHDDSVRPLLMTATPITGSPKELFEIVNTLIERKEQRLMPFEEFRTHFTNQDGAISPQGQAYYLERAKGLVSYLNREYDPTTFAQPNFHKITIQLKGTPTPTAEEIIQHCGIQRSADSDVGNLSPKEQRRRKKNKTLRKKAKTQDLKSCYQQTRKEYEDKQSGQLQSIEQCFGNTAKFPSLREVIRGLRPL